MSLEDNIGYRDEGETCVVCGKGLRPGEALATMHQEGRKLPICCPLCLEAYQKARSRIWNVWLSERCSESYANQKMRHPDRVL